MTEELQSLLERINQEGVEKAEQEKERIISEAQEEAQKKIDSAKEEAQKIIDDAKSEAELTRQKGREQLQNAARDVMLSLRQNLQSKMKDVVTSALANDVPAEAFAKAIAAFTEKYMETEEEVTRLEAAVSKEHCDAVRDYLMEQLGEKLKQEIYVSPVKHIQAGFSLNFNNQDIWYDFTDEALAEVLCAFVNPQIAEVLRAEVSSETESQGESDK